ncbi:hypothetical protein CKO_00749 [Citrobacter koseri ATCC BAA-895]|uniref:Uncharacterized protein n=1 Tax=Citrobacter koseri (strain ATCC BAA-895 / CDC 4225-83 / SGSC4696) TaxID=290338 RepID=A8AEI8_CITK8|nr:hypothetical protein CKO_00749 [Citrobacter koseri ATCC BAA-895]
MIKDLIDAFLDWYAIDKRRKLKLIACRIPPI